MSEKKKKQTRYSKVDIVVTEQEYEQKYYPKNWCAAWMGNFADLLKQLTKREMQIFLEIAKKNGPLNAAEKEVKAIAKTLGMRPNHVYTALKKLEGLDVIREDDQGYKINCDYVWYGNISEFWDYRRKWRQLTRADHKLIDEL